jgi:hypothetical protein
VSKNHSDSEKTFYAQAEPIISSAQKYLIQNREWLNLDNLTELQKRDVKVTDLFANLKKGQANTSNLSTQVEIDGIIYDVAVELANKDNMEEFSKRMAKGALLLPTGVAPDPDLDPVIEGEAGEPEATITIQVLREDNTIESITFMNAEYRQELDFDTTGIVLMEEYAGLGLATAYNQQILNDLAYPLFYVTLQEQDPTVATKSTATTEMTNSSGLNPWLEIHKINLYVKNDDGDEEFELYFGEIYDSLGRHSSNSYVDGEYSQGVKFDGATRENPTGSGRSAYFRNVNKPGETFSDPILIQKLYDATENRSGVIAFVDNDYQEKYIYRNWNAGTGYYKKNLWASNIRDGKHKVRTEYFQTFQKSGINQDDPYRDEIIGISAGNVNNRIQKEGKNEFWHLLKTNTLGQLNSDLSVKFKRGYWSY